MQINQIGHLLELIISIWKTKEVSIRQYGKIRFEVVIEDNSECIYRSNVIR